MSLAEEAIKSAATRRLARTVVIKDAEAYDRLYGELQTGMSNAWNASMREGIAAALDRLRDLGPGQFTREDGDAIMRILEASVGRDAIASAMREPVINLTDALFRTGAEEVGKATGVAIAFARPDLDALDVLKSGNLYWIGNSWNIRTQNAVAKILDDYFTEGMTREGLTQRFAEDFAGMTDRSRVYWEMLADHTATKTREIGRVSGYERAAVKRVQVRAHLDEGTTEICRHMHGRIIEVTRLRDQVNNYLEAVNTRNETAAKAAWSLEDRDLTGVADKDLPRDIASPPYHFRCRTITVAYFEPGKGWQIAEIPVVPSQTRARVADWARENVAKQAGFNSGISAQKAAQYTAALGQARAHFDLGKLERLASGSMITSRAKDALAFYVDDLRLMGVNASAFKDLSNPERQRRTIRGSRLDFDKVPFRWFAIEKPTVEYIARHEYGHWFHDTYRAEVDKAMSDALADDPGWPQMISYYGAKNRSEWFAETFALYFEGPEQRHRIAPPVLKLLEEKDRLNDT